MIWLIFVGTFAGSIVAVEAGFRWAQRRKDVETEAPVGAMVGAVLGLLAFLLAVTFGFAADRFIARKRAVIDEANAIRTAFMRAGLIAEPRRSEVRKLLRHYVEERLTYGGVQMVGPDRSAAELLRALTDNALAVGQENPNSEAMALFVESVNRVEEMHHDRLMSRERTRVPGVFWVALYLVAALSLGAMGYYCAIAGTTRSPVSVLVAFSFAAVIVLIADLDRPTGGLAKVNQQSMIDVRDSMAASVTP